MRKLLMSVLLSLVLGLPYARANSLWLGTDNTNSRPVLNTTLAGVEIGRVNLTEATGIAIDLANNLIYFGTSAGQITGRNLNAPATTVSTINPATVFGEDMAFDGTFLWRVDISAQLVLKINPSNGNIVFSFDPGFTPLGLAWDGANLWVSQFTANGLVKQFTPLGAATGNQFITPLGGNTAGGLAFDTSNGTLWLGAFSTVYHLTTTGTLLGSFAVPVPDGRFVDGLEFQGTRAAIPEPASVFLLGSCLVLLGGIVRKARNR